MLLDEKGKINDRRRTAPGAQARCWRPEGDYLPKKDKGAGAPSHPQKETMMKFVRSYLKDNKSKKGIGRMEVWKALNACKDFNPLGAEGFNLWRVG